jgi:hypothetical protein
MKKITLTLGLAALVSASQATLFNTTVFSTADSNGASPNLSPSFAVAGNGYTANLTGAVIGPTRSWLDITWWHTFDTTQSVAGSPAVPAYSAVTQVISGRVRRTDGPGTASFDASLTETILNGNGGFNGSTNPILTYSGNVGTQFQTFSFTVQTLFNSPLTTGTAQKDNLFLNANPNVEVVIDSIQQNYTPVPEPVTMIALGTGALGLLARRRRISK